MASNLPFVVLLLLVSLSLTSGYIHSTRDDESHVVATSHDQTSSMIIVEDLVKARSLQAILAGSKLVVVNKKGSSSGSKSSSKKSSKKNSKRKKKRHVGAPAIVGLVVLGIVVLVLIIGLIYWLLCLYAKYKIRKAKRIEQQDISAEEINGSSYTHISKTENV